MAAATQGAPPQSAQQQQIPRLTVPREVPVTSTLVELSSQSLMTPEELLALAQPLLNKELVREIGAIFKFIVTGECGGTYYLDLKTGLSCLPSFIRHMFS